MSCKQALFHWLRTCLAPWKSTFLSFGPQRIFSTLVTSECRSSLNLRAGRGGSWAKGGEQGSSCHLNLSLPGMLGLIPTGRNVMEPLPEASITWHGLQVLSLLYFSVISPLFCVIPHLFCVFPPLFNYYLTKRSLLQFLPLQIFFPLFLFFFSFKIHFLLLRDATICSISCCKQIHIGSGRWAIKGKTVWLKLMLLQLLPQLFSLAASECKSLLGICGHNSPCELIAQWISHWCSPLWWQHKVGKADIPINFHPGTSSHQGRYWNCISEATKSIKFNICV